MELSNTSNRKLKETFNKFEASGFAFTKTAIPMKSIFDYYPISRSEAKRLCSNLERFKEVELDFSGVPDMGQGFADQLFRVFKEANPNTKIIPKNMSEQVMRMFKHVTHNSN